jgi:hypothetical protein
VIYRMAQDVAATLAARLFPVRVQYGPERVSRTEPSTSSGVIIFSRDRSQSDVIRAYPASQRNPRAVRVRDLAVAVTVIARSPLKGARGCEHEHDCDQIVDGLIVALTEWSTEGKAGAIDFVEARYLTPEEFSGAEVGAGVAYRIRMRVPRAVLARNYEGAAQPTATLDGVEMTVRARAWGTEYEDVPLDVDPPEPGD